MALGSKIGVRLGYQGEGPDHGVFFGEGQASYLIAVGSERQEEVEARLEAAGLPCDITGTAGGEALVLTGGAGPLCDIPLDRLRDAHEGWMPTFMA